MCQYVGGIAEHSNQKPVRTECHFWRTKWKDLILVAVQTSCIKTNKNPGFTLKFCTFKHVAAKIKHTILNSSQALYACIISFVKWIFTHYKITVIFPIYGFYCCLNCLNHLWWFWEKKNRSWLFWANTNQHFHNMGYIPDRSSHIIRNIYWKLQQLLRKTTNVDFATPISCQIKLSQCPHNELPSLFNVCICTTLFIHFMHYDRRLKMVPQKYDYANLEIKLRKPQISESKITTSIYKKRKLTLHGVYFILKTLYVTKS